MLNIEGLAVSAVTDILAVCPRLKDQITANDKTPITDGHIDLYSSDKHKNTNLLGRVPVQVKGRTAPGKVRKRATSVSFSIDRATLDFFRNHGGGLYFYVPFSPEGKRKGVFYVSMMPYRIDGWLDDMKPGQKSLSVKMKRLPDDVSEVQRIVYLAWEARKQSGAQVNFSDIESQVESITLHTLTKLSEAQPTSFTLKDTDFAVTAKTMSGSVVPLNIDLVVYPGVHLPRPLNVPIACGGIEYEHSTIEHLEKNASRITLSDGLSIRAYQEDAGLRTNIDLTAARNLFDQVKDMSFFLAAAAGAPLVIGGAEMAPAPGDPGDVAEISTARERVQRTVAVLDSFKLGDDYARSLDITADDKRHLLLLHTALILNEEVPIMTDGLGRMNISIGGGHVSMLVTEGSDEKHRKLLDPFGPKLRGRFVVQNPDDESDGEEAPQWATIYEALQQEELAGMLNLHLDAIVDAYQALPDRGAAVQYANQMVLNLLAAADQSDGPRARYLLAGAQSLSDWLVSEAVDSLPHKINQWQTWHRLGSLGADVTQQIRKARRELRTSESRVAALEEACLAILLQDLEELDVLMEGLSAEDRGKLRSWPIWKLTDGAFEAA